MFKFLTSCNSFGVLKSLTIEKIEDIERLLIGNADHCLQMICGVGHERHGMNGKDAESSIDLVI